jgi:hypothetical protein
MQRAHGAAVPVLDGDVHPQRVALRARVTNPRSAAHHVVVRGTDVVPALLFVRGHVGAFARLDIAGLALVDGRLGALGARRRDGLTHRRVVHAGPEERDAQRRREYDQG